DDFLDEQRISAGPFVQHCGEPLRRCGNVEHGADHRGSCVPLERPQTECREMFVDGPGHLRVGPECYGDENRKRSDVPKMMAKELVGCLVRPMPVFQLED